MTDRRTHKKRQGENAREREKQAQRKVRERRRNSEDGKKDNYVTSDRELERGVRLENK